MANAVDGNKYPQTLVEFDEFFPDEAACRIYLEKIRWTDGFICPACRSRSEAAWATGRGLWACPHCRHQTSITAGTLFEGTRKPLRDWLLAAWEVTSQKYGASALGIQRTLGIGSYKTAWAWLHKLRRAMVRPNRDQLTEEVEVDETYVGGEEAEVRGRGTNKKALVAIAVELKGKEKQIGRIRLRLIPDASEDSLMSFVGHVVEPGSLIHTDGWPAYGKLPDYGYNHQVTILAQAAEPAHILMPHVHRVASLLKRWLLGTHQGAASREHLDYYLDEFTFRFNRRTSRSRGLLFYRLICQAVTTDPVPTADLFKSTNRGPPKGWKSKKRATPNR
jgi:transposase-like protein